MKAYVELFPHYHTLTIQDTIRARNTMDMLRYNDAKKYVGNYFIKQSPISNIPIQTMKKQLNKTIPTHTYTRAHTRTHTYIHVHTRTHTYTHTYIHVHTRTHEYTCVHTRTHTYRHVHIHTHQLNYILCYLMLTSSKGSN